MMNDLKSQIIKSAEELKSVWTLLNSNTNSNVPHTWIKSWSERSSLHNELSVTGDFLVAREQAWNGIEAFLKDLESTKKPEKTVNILVDRHLRLVAYMASTWAAYDRLSNCVGRLSGVSDIANHRQQNPKLVENLIGKNDNVGFGICKHIKNGYSWPICISYGLRNWIVHEGYQRGEVSLFTGNTSEDKLMMSADAKSLLEEDSKHAMEVNGGNKYSCLSTDEDYWRTCDLLKILPQYHGEIDTMFSAFIKWSVDSFVGQVQALGGRF